MSPAVVLFRHHHHHGVVVVLVLEAVMLQVMVVILDVIKSMRMMIKVTIKNDMGILRSRVFLKMRGALILGLDSAVNGKSVVHVDEMRKKKSKIFRLLHRLSIPCLVICMIPLQTV